MKLEDYKEIILSSLKELTLSQMYKFIRKDNTKIQVDDMYNIFVKNTEHKNNILVVAHLDRVLENEPRLFRYEEFPDRLYGAYGWDDRAGIIAALELFHKYDIDLLFTTGEEDGCVGAKRVQKSSIKQYDLIFELDRHGNSDFVNDCAMGLLCNDDFTKAITYHIGSKGMVLKPTRGVYTDIGALRSINNHAQMFYMSCGYYSEHTTNEYLVLGELQRSITIAGYIIEYVNEHPEVLKEFVPVVEPIVQEDNHHDMHYSVDNGFDCDYYCYNCDCYLYEDELMANGVCPYCRDLVEKMT